MPLSETRNKLESAPALPLSVAEATQENGNEDYAKDNEDMVTMTGEELQKFI